jgi:hypothetical protein
MPIAGWQSWAPDAAAGEYQAIVDAFRDFRKVFGTTPVVTDISFFEKRYELSNGVVVALPKTGAQFGVTDLTIFKSSVNMFKSLPLDKSNVQGSYGSAPPMSVGVVYGGSPKAAPLIAPIMPADNFKRAVVHELGHGLQSAAMNLPNPAGAIDPHMLDAYRQAVGWTIFVPAAGNKPAAPPALFDITVQAVKVAFNNNARPPSQYEITRSNWNDPNWGEQPVSEYSLDSPGEDFADSVMAYVYNPQLLQKRSFARFDFIDKGWQRWLPRMFTPPQGAVTPPKGAVVPGAGTGKKP